MTHSSRSATALALALCVCVMLGAVRAQLVPVKATITADNVYAIYWDTPSGLYFMGYEYNSVASGIFSQPEYWPAGPLGQHDPTPPANPLMLDAATDNIYVVAWSDAKTYNGILFQFDINGVLISSNNPNWQVYPTNYFPPATSSIPAINTELCNTQQQNIPTPNFGTTPFAAPCPDAVAQHVAYANANNLWQQPVRGGNNDATSLWGVGVPGIPATTKWMWWDSGLCGTNVGPNQAPFRVYNSPCHHKEYLIFRMPVKAYQSEPSNKCQMNPTKTACTGVCPLQQNGQKVDCVGRYLNGKLQSCSCECEDCELVIPTGDPVDNYCVGNCKATNEICQPQSFGHAAAAGTKSTLASLLDQVSPSVTKSPTTGITGVNDPPTLSLQSQEENYKRTQQLRRRSMEQEKKKFNEQLLAQNRKVLLDESLLAPDVTSFITSCGCGPISQAVCQVSFKDNKCVGVCPETGQTCIPSAFDLNGNIATCDCNPPATPCRLVQTAGTNGVLTKKCEGVCSDAVKQCKGVFVDGALTDCTCSCCELKSTDNPFIKRCSGECDASQVCKAQEVIQTPVGPSATKCGCNGCTASIELDGTQLCSGDCPTGTNQICDWQVDTTNIPRCTCAPTPPPEGCYTSVVNNGGTFSNVCKGTCLADPTKKCAFITDPATNKEVCDCPPSTPPDGCQIVTVTGTTGVPVSKCTGLCPADPTQKCVWTQADPTQPSTCECPSPPPPPGCQMLDIIDPATGVSTAVCQGVCPTDPSEACVWQHGPNGNKLCDCPNATPDPCTLQAVINSDGTTTSYVCTGFCAVNGQLKQCYLDPNSADPKCRCP